MPKSVPSVGIRVLNDQKWSGRLLNGRKWSGGSEVARNGLSHATSWDVVSALRAGVMLVVGVMCVLSHDREWESPNKT